MGWRVGVSCRGLSQSRGRDSAGDTAVSFLCCLCNCSGLRVAPRKSGHRNCDHALVRGKGSLRLQPPRGSRVRSPGFLSDADPPTRVAAIDRRGLCGDRRIAAEDAGALGAARHSGVPCGCPGNWQRARSCCFQAPSLWHFVRTPTGNRKSDLSKSPRVWASICPSVGWTQSGGPRGWVRAASAQAAGGKCRRIAKAAPLLRHAAWPP